MVLILFWGTVLLIAYTCAGFPVLVLARGLVWRRSHVAGDITPSVSLIIVAYNEAEAIQAKLDNVAALDYPPERIEVIVASDGSDDGTGAIVERYRRRQVKLLALPRQGKIPALNAAVAAATGDVLVFSDANSMYAPGAVRALVRHFADERVGGAAGNQRYLKHSGKGNDGEQWYWNYDRILKAAESRAGNTISATGAIYAIRRSLFRPVPRGVTDDFVTSTNVILQGYRLVFAADAEAFEPAAASSGAEFRRKVRLMTRGLTAVVVQRRLLNPFVYGFYALQLFSHKVLRRLVCIPLLALAIVSPFTWQYGRFYQGAVVFELVFFALAAAGFGLQRTKAGRWRIFSIPVFFIMTNAAALAAAKNVVLGRRIDLWETRRDAARSPGGEPKPRGMADREPLPVMTRECDSPNRVCAEARTS